MVFSLILMKQLPSFIFFFFNDTATTEIYTLSLHDALPIFVSAGAAIQVESPEDVGVAWIELFRNPVRMREMSERARSRSEEHTSELQSPCNLVCRLLLEKKKRNLCSTPPTTCALSTETIAA